MCGIGREPGVALSETEAAKVFAVPRFLLGLAGTVVVAVVEPGVDKVIWDVVIVLYEFVDGF
jgi:hypothetical protein